MRYEGTKRDSGRQPRLLLSPPEVLDRLAAARIHHHRYFGDVARRPLTEIAAGKRDRQELAEGLIA